MTEKSLIPVEKISPGVYPRVPVEAGSPLRSDKHGARSEALEGVEMT